MISNTKAFVVLKHQNQALMDFSVLCCQSVPALRGYMKAVAAGSAAKLPDADHFKGAPDFAQLGKFATTYRKTLGRLVFLSSFSYFEAYFKALIAEVLEFHGGREALVETSRRRQANHRSACDEPAIAKSAAKLREYKKPHWKPAYENQLRALEGTNFRFPSELFSTFGIVELDHYRELKASEIPHVAKWCFGVPLLEPEETAFSKWRDLRNDIAHGNVVHVDFKTSLHASRSLRELSIKIDKHVVRHFLVIERV